MAFKDLPKDKRQGVFAVYGFCREVDDAVDENLDFQHLYDYSNALEQLHNMDESQPILWALSDTINRYNIPIAPFRDMIIGQEMDIHFEGILNEEMLLNYSYHVASSVGLMLLPILATKHHDLIVESGTKLGYAMQITNILRDIGEDYHSKNRIYLPQDSLNEDIIQAIQSKKVNGAFIACWERFAKKAEDYYEDAIKDLKYYDVDSLVPITQAIVYYRGILHAVRANQYDCLNQRCKVKDLLSLQSEVNRIVKKVRKERAQLL